MLASNLGRNVQAPFRTAAQNLAAHFAFYVSGLMAMTDRWTHVCLPDLARHLQHVVADGIVEEDDLGTIHALLLLDEVPALNEMVGDIEHRPADLLTKRCGIFKPTTPSSQTAGPSAFCNLTMPTEISCQGIRANNLLSISTFCH